MKKFFCSFLFLLMLVTASFAVGAAPAKKDFSSLTIQELNEEVKKFKGYPSILIHLHDWLLFLKVSNTPIRGQGNEAS